MPETTYKVLSANNEDALAKLVNQYLASGYELSGGPAIGRDGRFHQGVVRSETSDLKPGEVRLREPKHKQR